MFYKKLEVNDFFDKKEDDKQVINLLERENAHLKIISVKKNSSFDSLISHTDVFIYVMDGELEIIFPKENTCGCEICGCSIPDEDDDTAKKYKLNKNQMFLFEKEIKHSVKALKDTKFLVVKI